MMSEKNNIILNTALHILNEELLVKMEVAGNSMFPFLKEGDFIFMRKDAMHLLKAGDIIAFKRNNYWVAHRLLAAKLKHGELIFLCKGDSCVKCDEEVNKNNFVGKIVAYSRNGEKVDLEKGWQKKLGQILVITSPVNKYILNLRMRVIFKIKRMLR